jgi:hypothetical protein
MKTVQRFSFGIAFATMLPLAVNLAPAQAGVLFDNGAPNLDAFFVPSDSSPSYPGLMLQGGEDFSLNGAASITKVTWSGIYLFGNDPSNIPLTDDFSVSLFNIVNGVPNINPFATLSGSLSRIDSGLDAAPDIDLYHYALTLATPFSIEAGNYLLSIVNKTTDDPDDNWAWAAHDVMGNFYYRESAGDLWQQDFFGELAFAIEGDTTSIPTPALLPGLVGFGLSVWRKRKAEA